MTSSLGRKLLAQRKRRASEDTLSLKGTFSQCSTNGGDEKCTKDFHEKNVREGDHLEDPGVDGRIILKWVLKKWYRGMDWVDLAQDRNSWWAVVNAVMNLRVPLNAGNFLSSLGTVRFTGRTPLHGLS